jgi:hypothetical protein
MWRQAVSPLGQARAGAGASPLATKMYRDAGTRFWREQADAEKPELP